MAQLNQGNKPGGFLKAASEKLAAMPVGLKRMDEIEAAMKSAKSAATPKTRDGFAILQRMIDDTRKFYKMAVPDHEALIKAIESAKSE